MNTTDKGKQLEAKDEVKFSVFVDNMITCWNPPPQCQEKYNKQKESLGKQQVMLSTSKLNNLRMYKQTNKQTKALYGIMGEKETIGHKLSQQWAMNKEKPHKIKLEAVERHIIFLGKNSIS